MCCLHGNERHSHTIGPPYNIDEDIESGESAVATFVANQEGFFNITTNNAFHAETDNGGAASKY